MRNYGKGQIPFFSLLLFTVVYFLDLMLTLKGLEIGFSEGNPFVRDFAPSILFGIKVIAYMVVVAMINQLDVWLARTYYQFGAVVFGIISIWNIVLIWG